jgi:hypothetical protein
VRRRPIRFPHTGRRRRTRAFRTMPTAHRRRRRTNRRRSRVRFNRLRSHRHRRSRVDSARRLRSLRKPDLRSRPSSHRTAGAPFRRRRRRRAEKSFEDFSSPIRRTRMAISGSSAPGATSSDEQTPATASTSRSPTPRFLRATPQ